MPDSVTQILRSGPPGAKLNIAVLGDGYAAGDQALYNNKVQEFLLDGVFGHDYFYEDKPGIQHLSRQPDLGAVGGQPARLRRARDAVGSVRRHDHLDDAEEHGARLHLQRLVGALLARGRREHRDDGAERAQHLGAGLRPRRRDPERARLRRLRRRRLPDRHLGRELGGDGARVRPRHRRARRRVLRKPGTYTGAEPGAVDLTINTNRATLKWRQFVNPTTPIPTGHRLLRRLHRQRRSRPGGATARTSACSRAAARGRSGIYRPVINCRMRGNSPPFCPVCYTQLKTQGRAVRAAHIPELSTRATSTATARTTSSSTTATRS